MAHYARYRAEANGRDAFIASRTEAEARTSDQRESEDIIEKSAFWSFIVMVAGVVAGFPCRQGTSECTESLFPFTLCIRGLCHLSRPAGKQGENRGVSGEYWQSSTIARVS